MTGKGKVGKKQSKRELSKKLQRTSSITRGGIRRLARRGGVKRIASTIYNDTREFIDYFLNTVVKDSVIYCQNSQRKTITAMDVILALKKSGRTIYGYGV